MKKLGIAMMLLSASFLLAQDSKGPVTVQGCVSRSSGDYILTKQDPGVSYELQASGKTKLKQYLGQQVEVTGTESPSSDMALAYPDSQV